MNEMCDNGTMKTQTELDVMSAMQKKRPEQILGGEYVRIVGIPRCTLSRSHDEAVVH